MESGNQPETSRPTSERSAPATPATPAPPSGPAPAQPPRRRGLPWGVLGVLVLLIALFVSVLFNVASLSLLAASGLLGEGGEDPVQEKFFSHNRQGPLKVAIISVEGLILDGEGFVKKQIEHARRDWARGNLKAVVLRVDSPGGTVSGSDMIYHELRKFAEETEVPIVVSMGSLAASGGYYVSMAVGETPNSVYAEPTTWTGSIGVIIPHYNAADLLDRWGIKEDSIASHPLKNMGSFARQMTDEERAIFQGLVDESFDRFKDVVCRGRPKFRQDPEALNQLATGQIFTAEQARQNGLVDRIGFLEDAVERAIELAGLQQRTDEIRVVRYKKQPTVFDVLLGADVKAQSQVNLEMLLEMTTPRAYYLCTWLPPLAQSARP